MMFKSKNNFLMSVLVVTMVCCVAAASTRAETVHSGILSNLTGVGDLDLSGNIVYAIDVGGPGRTLGGVMFDRDQDSNAAQQSNNGIGIGSTPSTSTPGYYPALNAPGNWNTSFSGDADLDAIMSYGRNDSGWDRVSQFDVTVGTQYKIQILGKAVGAEDRTWDLAIGFGTAADNANSGALEAWQQAHLAVDNWQESTPKVWTQTLTATSPMLWIGASHANRYGDAAPADPNPIVNAIIVSSVIPEPSGFILAAMAMLGLFQVTLRRRRRA